MDNRVSLFKKILAVQKSLEPLEKSGRNDFHKYSYTTAGNVLLPVQRACNAHGLIILSDVVESKIEPGKAWVTVKLTIADVDTGESITASAPGYAEDWSYKDNRPSGDKAVYKAITGATKYAVRSFFCLPSEDDPERQERQSTTTNSQPTKPVAVHSLQPSASTTVRESVFTTSVSNASGENETVNTLQPTPSESTPSKPVTSNGITTTALIEQTSVEMLRVNWTATEGRQFLEQNFGKRARKELTATELHWFLDYLRSLPSTRAPSVTAA